MYLSLAFWLALLPTGYVLARKFNQSLDEAGLPAMLAVSMFWSLGALAPISILCYVLKTPVWVFSTVCVAHILIGPSFIYRNQWWPEIRKLLLAGLTFELLILILDSIMGAIAGSYYIGDALTHLARVRFLLDHGFSNADPFIGEPYFWPIYHTNHLHALIAAATQLTGLRSIDFWVGSLPAMKLFLACSAYTLAWTTFRNTTAAWLTAIAVAATYAHSTLLIYPNKIAPLILIPLAIAFAIRAITSSERSASLLPIAMASLIIGQIHGLYALFLIAFLSPVLLCIAIVRKFTSRASVLSPLFCVAALCAGLPFPLISTFTRATPDAAVATASTSSHQPDNTDETRSTTTALADPEADDARTDASTASPLPLLSFADSMKIRNPSQSYFANLPRTALFIIGSLLSLTLLRERRAWLPIGFVLAIAAMLFLPPLCSLALRVLREPWILIRAEGLLGPLFCVLIVPPFWLALRRLNARHASQNLFNTFWVRSGVALAICPASVFLNKTQTDFTDYFQHLQLPRARRFEMLDHYKKSLRELSDFFPAGSRIVCPIEFTPDFVSRFDVHTITSLTTSVGVPDLAQRTRDNDALLNPRTPWSERLELLQKYNARYYILLKDADLRWTAGRIARIDQSNNTITLFELNLRE